MRSAEETEMLRDVQRWQPVPLTLMPDALALICRLTNCAAGFLRTTTDNTGRQDGKAKARQRGGGDVCSPLCGASLLGGLIPVEWTEIYWAWAPQSRLTVVQVHLSSQVKLASGQLATLTGGASACWSLLGDQFDSVAKGLSYGGYEEEAAEI